MPSLILTQRGGGRGRSAAIAALAHGRGSSQALAVVENRPAVVPAEKMITIKEAMLIEDLSPLIIGYAPHGISAGLSHANDQLVHSAYCSIGTTELQPTFDVQLQKEHTQLIELVCSDDRPWMAEALSGCSGSISVCTGSFADATLQEGGCVAVCAIAGNVTARKKLLKILHAVVIRGGPVGCHKDQLLRDGMASSWLEVYNSFLFADDVFSFQVISPPGCSQHLLGMEVPSTWGRAEPMEEPLALEAGAMEEPAGKPLVKDEPVEEPLALEDRSLHPAPLLTLCGTIGCCEFVEGEGFCCGRCVPHGEDEPTRGKMTKRANPMSELKTSSRRRKVVPRAVVKTTQTS